MSSHKRMVGDTLTPLNAKLARNGSPVDLSSLTVKFQLESDAGISLLAETTTGVTAHPTSTFTVDTTNNWIVANAHGLKDQGEVIDQIIVSNSGGALPTGLAASTRYFVKDATPNNFRVSLTPGGAAVTISGAGTGTHSMYALGSVQYDFSATAAGTAGSYRGWFTVYSGSEFDTFPPDKAGIRIEVLPYGN